jgi:branched-chain amino acid transport system ATP-binding protein
MLMGFMLEIDGLKAGYGSTPVLFDVSLSVGAGEVVSLLGRNGMGKTTTLRALMGLVTATGGTIVFEGKRLIGRTPESIARAGIGLVPEGRQVFPTLTVRENLIATARPGPWTLARVCALFPILEARRAQSAATLSGGEQQMLAIGRALMTNPRLLVLDEATEGLAPMIRREIWQCLRQLKSEGQAILIVDKNLRVLQGLAERHVILQKGVTVWRGESGALLREAATVESLLGV